MVEALVALGSLGLLSMLPLLHSVRQELKGTTLISAWGWAVSGVLLWCAAWTLSLLSPAVNPGLADQFWYAAALVLLCAAISVLGAKQPAARVWGWFILLPLMLVLGWPALFAWKGGWSPELLTLPEPAFVAYCFVCIMGFGNYIGTRFAISALLGGAALLCAVIPVATVTAVGGGLSRYRIAATFCLIAAVWLPMVRRRTPRQAVRINRVWKDFRDYYGIVWGRRIQQRFNAHAEKLGWSVRLADDGLFWPALTADVDGKVALEPAGPQSAESSLRWLLRRFVSDEWIERRLED